MDRRQQLMTAASWTPFTPGVPLLWMDATFGVTQSGGSVSAWASRTNGATFTQGVSAAQPKFSGSGWATGKPAIQFGSRAGLSYTDLRSSDATAALAASRNFTMVTTMNGDTGGGGPTVRQFILTYDNGVTALLGWGSNATDLELLDLHAGGADITGNALMNSVNHRTFMRRVSSSNLELTKIDGVTSINASDGADTSGCNRMVIGGQAVIGVSPYNGALAELIIWAGAPDVDAAYRHYSAAKWGT
jgi:hypothetical protein